MKKIVLVFVILLSFLLLCSFSNTILLGKFDLDVYNNGQKVFSKQYKIKTSTMMTVIFRHNGNFSHYYKANKDKENIMNFTCLNDDMYDDIMYEIEKIEFSYTNSTMKWDNKESGFVFVDGKNGLMVDQNNLVESLYSELGTKTNLNLITKEVPMRITIDMLKDKTYERGSFSTTYKSSIASRKHNIALATQKLCGQKIAAGQNFSFNEVVGRRTEENGFKKAKIISQGLFVDGIGGGVCQVSTTLYNAWIRAGLEAVNAINHSLPVSYVPPSMDAMVSSKNDLILRNNTKEDVYIKAFTKDDTIFISIYGIKTRERVELRNEIIRTIPSAEYEELDMELNWKEGEEFRIISSPKSGIVSIAYKDIFVGNKLVRTEKLRTNTYQSQKGKIVKRKKEIEQESEKVYSNLYHLIDDNTFLCINKVIAEV